VQAPTFPSSRSNLRGIGPTDSDPQPPQEFERPRANYSIFRFDRGRPPASQTTKPTAQTTATATAAKKVAPIKSVSKKPKYMERVCGYALLTRLTEKGFHKRIILNPHHVGVSLI
jgi:hypothetical protein